MTHDDLNALSAGTASPETQMRAAAEIEDLRISVIAFGVIAATERSRLYGLPNGHLMPVHYDALQRAGARMTDYVRAQPLVKEGVG